MQLSNKRQNSLPQRAENNRWLYYNGSNTVIVFVHGIFSDSTSCWSSSGGRYWPDMVKLDQRFHDVSIYLGGFHTSIDSGQYDIRDCADELFRAISSEDAELAPPVTAKANILFVCHSTGGIVVRDMLYRERELFATKKIGLVLIASPSFGADTANTLSLLCDFYNHKLGKQLRWASEALENLDHNFKDLIGRQLIPGLRGVEAYEHHFIVHRKWLPSRRVVVTEESACRYFPPGFLMPGTDHFTIAKPETAQHPTYTLLASFFGRHFDPDDGRLPRDFLVIGKLDDAYTRDVERILDKRGWPKVVTLDEAAKLVVSHDFHAVLVDTTAVDSFERLTSWILAKRPRARVIALSPAPSPSWIETRDAFVCGAADYIAVTSHKDLARRIDEALGRPIR